MAYDDDNIFAKILRGEIPNRTVKETPHTLAFADIRPQAPRHILVIPKGRYSDFDDFCRNATDEEIIDFHRTAGAICAEIAATEGYNGYRVIANTGEDGRQEVAHYHLHILAGKDLGVMLASAAPKP